MEHAKEIINIIFNSKVGEIIAIAICALVVFAYIFSRTSIGKKAIFKLTTLSNTTRSYVDTTKENIETKVENYKNKAEEKSELCKQYIESFRQEMFDVLKYVPNAKVKKFVLEHESLSVEDLIKKYAKDALKSDK